MLRDRSQFALCALPSSSRDRSTFRRTASPHLVSRGDRQSGQTIVVVAVALVALLAMLGLAIDIGYFRYLKRQLQTAADAAAMAGAAELPFNDVVAAAKADSSANGFADGKNGVTVTVNNPPKSGQHIGDSKFVEVIVSDNASTFFAKAFGVNSTTMSARAVSHLGNSSNCVFALDPSAQNAINVSGNGSLKASCGLIIDSSNSQALVVNGNACVTAPSIGVVGNFKGGKNGCPNPTPTTGIRVAGDPLAYLTAPSVGSCTFTNFNNSSSSLSPGTYCGGITLSGNGNFSFAPGMYILEGGGLTVSGNAQVSGSGLTFFNTGNSTFHYSPVTFSGNAGGSLTAPTTGSYAGILFYQDPAIGSNPAQNTFSGNATLALQGALYFPTTPLSISGNGSSGTAAYTIYVATTISISGNSVLNDDFSSLPSGSPIRGNSVLDE
ncbi:MAG: pilus assembly protein TadG-related protein [Candidatus Acidiferrales bacterium]